MDGTHLPEIKGKRMKLKVLHTLNYTYAEAVKLTPHYIYLTPRVSPYQELITHKLTISPNPNLRVKNVDAEGNIQHIAYVNEPCDSFQISSEIVLESNPFNPFDFVYFPFEAQNLPFAYLEDEKLLLTPYLDDTGITTIIHQTAREIAADANWSTATFLNNLSTYIHDEMSYQTRLEGSAYDPEQTLSGKIGSCRDFSALMIAFCKSMGIAARFVSGYCYGSERQAHSLHAWVEVYLPGGGWRGFDPTEGQAVNKNYVALAASAQSDLINPVTGTYKSVSPVVSTLQANVDIEAF